MLPHILEAIVVYSDDVMLAALEAATEWFDVAVFDPDGMWCSLAIDDEMPHVERVWRPMGDEGLRVAIHRIAVCETRPLFHAHRWPAAFRILCGRYRSGIGHGPPDGNPPDIERVVSYPTGSRYAMTDPSAWHWVSPEGAPTITLMVIGPPYPGKHERTPRTPLGPLTPEAKRRLLLEARHCLDS